jgi:hypothetical protein
MVVFAAQQDACGNNKNDHSSRTTVQLSLSSTDAHTFCVCQCNVRGFCAYTEMMTQQQKRALEGPDGGIDEYTDTLQGATCRPVS